MILFIFCAFFSEAQTFEIDYCGIFSEALDQNMAKLTSDLYYTQLSEIQNFSVVDKRAQFEKTQLQDVDKSVFTSTNKTFFAEINKKPSSDKWLTVFHIFYEGNEVTKVKEYDSYYKILMEPKENLRATLSDLITRGETGEAQPAVAAEKAPLVTSSKISTDFLSGTWKGEDGLNKVVIMRGGRGFVIFNNGASMNISISLSENTGSQKITVLQNQRSNASFFPQLSRQVALEHAVNAQPIEWTLQAKDSNTLIGQKRTLVENTGEVSYDDIPVTWTRIN
jgi:hypothetical protein